MTGYEQYINDVESNNIIACEFIKLAVQRFRTFQSRSDIYFDSEKVAEVIQFVGLIKHFKGESAGKNFKLENWQEFIVANIFGWKYKHNNQRVTKNVFLFMARKSGKSAFVTALSLYLLIAEGEASPEIILAANSREQAKDTLLNTTVEFSKVLDSNEKYIKNYRNEIKFKSNKGKIKVVSADTSKLDGLNTSTFIIDEYHESKDNKMYSVLKSSQGNRQQPLSIIITTAGFNLQSPCYEMFTTAIDILRNTKQDDSFFSAIYTLDENDNWDDERVWIKSNPNLNITVSTDYIKGEVLSAKNNSSNEVGVKTKNLNLWCSSNEVWLTHDTIVKNSKKLDIKDFAGQVCYCGVDLSCVSDLTAVSFMFFDEKNDKYSFITKYYLPQSALTEHQQKEYYKKMHYQKQITMTNGNVVDYNYIKEDLLKINELCPIAGIFYDTYNATSWAIDCTDAGLNLIPFSQSKANFNRPTKELERLIRSDKVVIDNNLLTQFCFDNVVFHPDNHDNVKPEKTCNKNKIDGIISMVSALGGFFTIPKVDNDFDLFVI
ncbi:terminase TerL endonuclease subunit [uncultured Bacteroides sp.]|uniref:terminase large subunit n=1 Tax=uncultured Bacteroides sp. TaxID=162156 RepID=UPI002AA7B72C|nr:terminase TerL endonuclease subunit [uncultured Bacteroides sp.]